MIDDYESRLPLNLEENAILDNTKAELEEKTLERIQGVMFSSKAKCMRKEKKIQSTFIL